MSVFGPWCLDRFGPGLRLASDLHSHALARIGLSVARAIAPLARAIVVSVHLALRGNKTGGTRVGARPIARLTRRRPATSGHATVSWLVIASAALAVLLAPGGQVGAGEAGGKVEAPAGAPPPGAEPAATANADRGRELFAIWACGSCHILAGAGAAGQVGPPLDGNPNLSVAIIVSRITNGQGAMPPLGGQLSEDEIADIAAFVIQAAAK